ncbi:MAG: glycosyltransferase [Moorea sp. SIO2I5]|nr:glycosyltransferase [Moorena sp. SIO2I5]
MKPFPLNDAEVFRIGANPLVSVIINNYNYGAFLKQAIDSVLEQTYKNVELIVVDDGSTDNSKEIIESYGNDIIAIFQRNAGQGAALNTGITRSQGQIVCLLDSDDYFRQDKLAKVVAGFQKHPEWLQISNYCTSVNSEGLSIGSGSHKSLSQGDVRNFLLKHGKYKSIRSSALAYRREALQQVLPISTQRNGFADAYLMAKIPFYGKVGSINEPLTFYRIHGENRHARTSATNLPYHIRGREVIADYINETTVKLGLTERFDIQYDADYRTFNALQMGGVSWVEALQIIWLTLQESLYIGRSMKETLTRLLWGSICVLFPHEGTAVLSLGLNQYLRSKLLGETKVEINQKKSVNLKAK